MHENNKMLKNKIKISLIIFSILIFSVSYFIVSAEELIITRTATTNTICDINGKCTATSNLGFINYWNGKEYLPINRTIVSSSSLWDYEVIKGVYQAYFKINPTEGQVIKFEINSTSTTFQPMALNYGNDLNQLQQISMIQSVSGIPNENTFTYKNAYGNGIDLEYKYKNGFLKENLIINSSSDLINPEQFIIEGGNPTLDLNFILETNSNHIIIEGVDWDKSTTKETSEEVYIKDDLGNTLYFFHKPFAYDSDGNSQLLTYKFKKQGNSLLVIISTPYSWLENSSRVYPLFIDPSEGPNNPGTMADDSAVGSIAWILVNNAKASDDTYADVDATEEVLSHYLKGTNFSFSIPSGATIDGIKLEMEEASQEEGAELPLEDTVKLVKSGTVQGNDKSTGAILPFADTYITYGNETDLWGLTWTVADINADNFGMVFSITLRGQEEANSAGFVDHIRITIYYTEAVGDSCTFNGLNNNWEINMSHFCNITANSNLGTGNITWVGEGTTLFNATINTKNLGSFSSSQTLNIGSDTFVSIG